MILQILPTFKQLIRSRAGQVAGISGFKSLKMLIQLESTFAVGNGSYLTPSNPMAIANSNIRGIQDGAKFIIISHKNFLDAANRSKSHRESQARLPISTIVIDVENIFNEFSCGIRDISAIRDFIKYAYDNWQIKPEYFF